MSTQKNLPILVFVFSFLTIAANNQRTIHELYVALAEKLPQYKIDFNGYIKFESFWDSRQVVGFQQDQDLFFPNNRLLDVESHDINSKGQFTMVPIESRIKTTIHGPDVNKAKTRGVFEADFFGKSVSGNEILNSWRMRHAFAEFKWERFHIIAGQAYTPIFVLDCFPVTVGFNTGAPIEPLSRSPQIQCIAKPIKSLDLIFAAISEVDFKDDGPNGFSTEYVRNAIVPILHGQVKGRFNSHVIGAGVEYKRLVPRIVTNKNIKVRESLNGITGIAYAHLQWDTFILSNKITYAQNGPANSMLGGYAVTEICEETDERKYTNLNVIGLWTDMIYTGGKIAEPGLFVGYLKNLGATNKILQNEVDNNGDIIDRRIFGFGTDIDHLIRVAPRVRFHLNKTTIAGELEYTRAAFGDINDFGRIDNAKKVGNLRFMFAIYYHF